MYHKSMNSDHMIARGRQLRRDSTFPERLLWGQLRDRRCANLKFRRQQPFGPYVADFFCESPRVVVELDGRSHEGRQAYDAERQQYLERQGLKVIRFTNDAVLTNLSGVVEAIAAACGSPSPSERGQGERAG
jgi:very-short-patch-repair endonuclease